MYKQHTYLTFGGGIGPGEGFEQWSTGLRYSNDPTIGPAVSPPIEAVREFLEDNIRPELESLIKQPYTHISSAASLQWAKLNVIGPDGKYVESETVEIGFTNVRGGGLADATTLKYPSQVSLVATLHTDASRGYASKGRMYLPCPNVTLGLNGLIDETQADEVAQAVAGFVSATTDNVISGALSYSFQPAVESKLGNGGDGTERGITRVSVDTRLDIQRSRAKSLRGVRQYADL